ncbi:MAG: thymidylate kinase [Candidatus Sungbacteria bacterium]|nr:thymidylate kinase [Candidatus Sungbacteria bacterium]
MKSKGIFIALEGTDGSGKKTQKDLLVKRLKKERYGVQEISFPQYGKPSAWQIEQYLNGLFGKPDDADPYFASILYADDRREAKPKIEKWLKKGSIVIADRYAASNAGHQGGKIANPSKRKRYLNWLWETEFQINRIPIPTLNIILWVPPAVAYRLISKKNKRNYLKKGRKRDGHESNFGHLRRAAASYRWVAKQNPRHFKIVDCTHKGALRTPEEVHEQIWRVVAPILKKTHPKK